MTGEGPPGIPWRAFRPGRWPRLAGLAAGALFAVGVLAALLYGLRRPEPELRWPSVAGVVGFIVAPLCLLILLLAALNERRPPARLALSAPAALLAVLMVALAALSPAETGAFTLFCLGPLALLIAAIPLLALRQTPAYLRAERLRVRGADLRAYLEARDGLLRYRDAARDLNLTEVSLRTLVADLEEAGELAGQTYAGGADAGAAGVSGLYVSAPGEERGVVRVQELLRAGHPREAASLAESLGVPLAVVEDWLGQAQGHAARST